MVRGKPEVTTATSEAEDNTEILARQECSRLARQLRLMENDKRAYLEESNAAIYRQKKLIEMLEKENSQIQKKLEIAKERNEKEKSSGNLEKVLALVDTLNELEEEYARESQVHKQVAKKISATHDRVKQLKSKVDANLVQKELPLPQLENKIYVLSKKLETVRGQFDAIIAENKSLREKIDETYKENISVRNKCTELDEVVGKGKEEIDEIVAEATAAYDQREETVAKINALSERNAKETKQYTLEMSELTRLIRHEVKLLEFMWTKNKERVFLETDEERVSRIEQAKEHILDQTLESYRENFEKLLNETSPTISALVEEFTVLQKDNIAKFAYTNELNDEIEATQNDFFRLREEIKRSSLETVERNRAKNEELVSKQFELEEMKTEYEEGKEALTSWNSIMGQFVELIKTIYHLTDFSDVEPVLSLLGKQGGITFQNVVMYINIVQPRIAELINYKGRDDGRGQSPAIVSKSPRPPSKTLSETSFASGSGIMGPGQARPASTSASPRPKIIVTSRKDTLVTSDDEIDYNLLEDEHNPLGYTAMRHKVLDYVGSRSPSVASGDEND